MLNITINAAKTFIDCCDDNQNKYLISRFYQVYEAIRFISRFQFTFWHYLEGPLRATDKNYTNFDILLYVLLL